MLRITKIINEMVDLETGTTFSHGVVVSNDFRDVFVPLPEDSLKPLMELYVESINAAAEYVGEELIGPADPGAELPKVTPAAPANVVAPVFHPAGAEPQHLAPTKPQLIDPQNQVEFTPAEPEPAPDEGPGEEYDHAETGVASI